jgi:hypothetical protein
MAPKRTLKKTAVVLFGCMLALLFTGLFTLAGGVLFLHSPAGQSFLLGKGRAFLGSKFHIDIQYSEGSLDILSGLHFKDLRILIRQDSLDADITITSLDLNYVVQFMTRHLEIEDFKILHPSVKVTMRKSNQPEPQKESANPAESLRSFLESPLATVRLRHFSLENLVADIKNEAMKITIRDLSLFASLDVSQRFFGLNGELRSGQPMLIQTSDLRAQLALSGTWDMTLKKEGRDWLYEVKPTHLQILAQNLELAQIQSNSKTTLRLESAAFKSDLQLHAKAERFFNFDRASFQTVDVAAKIDFGKLSILQGQKNQAPQIITISSQELGLVSKLADNIKTDLHYHATDAFTKTDLIKPIDIDWSAQSTLSQDLSAAQLKSTGAVGKIEILSLDSQMQRKTKPASVRAFQGTLTLFANSKLNEFLKPAASLKKLNSFAITTSFNGELEDRGNLDLKTKTSIPNLQMARKNSPMSGAFAIEFTVDTKWRPEANHLDLSSNFDFSSENQGHWLVKWTEELDHVTATKIGEKIELRGHGAMDITEATLPDEDHKLPLKLLKPLVAMHDFAFSQGQLIRAEANANMPLVDLLDFGAVPNTTATFKARSSDLTKAKDLDIEFEMKQGAGPTLQIGVQARGNTQTQELQARGNLALQISNDFPFLAKTSSNSARQKLRGKISFPWTLAIVRGEELDLKGLLSLDDVAWSSESVSVKGVTGQIPISEKLKLELKPGGNGQGQRRWAFKDLVRQNAFERVDFERLRPLLENSSPLRISEIHWEDKTYGPFIGFFEVHQNMIFAHQFDLDIGSGRVYGEMSFDADPANLQVSLLARLTALNLNEILPSRYLAGESSANQTLSARSGLILNLNTGTIDGRVDVTQIGGPQLTTLVNLMDPKYANEKMNNLRKILEVGYPTSVQAAFSEGYMDLDVDLSILGVPKNQSVRGIPMSSLISSKTAGLVQTIGEGYFP